jgi:hypothetical protein
MSQRFGEVELTLRGHIEHLLARSIDDGSPQWPGDVFGACMSALLVSGSYCEALSSWPPESSSGGIQEWGERAREIGDKWRADWRNPPSEVALLWKSLVNASTVTLTDLRKDTEIAQILLELCAIADEACAGVGVPPEQSTAEDMFYFFADSLLSNEAEGASLCCEVDKSKLRVLPKMRTPQSGLTIRSLSHNLCLIMTNEMKPRWITRIYSRHETKHKGRLNLLVVPWPRQTRPDQFFETKALQQEMRNMPKDFGFFSFRQDEGEEVVEVVKSLLTAAKSKVERIDGVVFPEAALTPKQHWAVRREVLAAGAFLIAGGGVPSLPAYRSGENLVHIDVPGLSAQFQHKHHRWKLDGGQIAQYGLQSQLDVKQSWWEHINVGSRELIFVSYSEWLVFAVLICEDLARPDPVGDLVRAVGPNLVIALLMDGPQTKNRWGCQYASVLAEDPGSSVLTVTSAGMCSLSKPRHGEPDRSGCVALWRQAKESTPVPRPSIPMEIDISSGAKGIVLCLSNQYFKEWTADGRGDSEATGYPLLSCEPVMVP